MPDNISNKFKVRLRSTVFPSLKVTFDVTPEVSETRSVNYKTLDPVHMPGQIYSYGNTASRVFQVSNAKLISRTREEAAKNLIKLQILRAWTMPYFGIGSKTSSGPGEEECFYEDCSDLPGADSLVYGKEWLGAPPDVLYFWAYADNTVEGGTRTNATNLSRIPVMMQTLNIPYPSDCDYIPTAGLTDTSTNISVREGTPFPTVMTIDFQLNETHSPREYANFSLSDFRAGVLPGF